MSDVEKYRNKSGNFMCKSEGKLKRKQPKEVEVLLTRNKTWKGHGSGKILLPISGGWGEVSQMDLLNCVYVIGHK